jgi:hypothetical protein
MADGTDPRFLGQHLRVHTAGPELSAFSVSAPVGNGSFDPEPPVDRAQAEGIDDEKQSQDNSCKKPKHRPNHCTSSLRVTERQRLNVEAFGRLNVGLSG